MVIYADALFGFVLISTLDEASGWLFDRWAGNNSPAWVEAMCRCGEGGGVDHASAAFLAALKGADMCATVRRLPCNRS